MSSANNLVASEPLQARAVDLPISGAGRRHATIPVEVYALGFGIALVREPGDLSSGQGSLELEAAGRRFVINPLASCKGQWLVPAVEGDVAAIGQALQAIDEEEFAELSRSGVVHGGRSRVEKTAILSLPQGWGKTTMARRIAAHIGCTRIVDEWWPGQPILGGALHLTSADDVLGAHAQGGAA